MQSKKNLVSVLSVVSLLLAVVIGTKESYANDNDVDSSLLEIVEENNATLQQKEANKTPKDKLLESVIRSKT